MKSLSINVEIYFTGDSEEKFIVLEREIQKRRKRGEGGEFGMMNLKESALNLKFILATGRSTAKRL